MPHKTLLRRMKEPSAYRSATRAAFGKFNLPRGSTGMCASCRTAHGAARLRGFYNDIKAVRFEPARPSCHRV
jgi:hypothetical protein